MPTSEKRRAPNVSPRVEAVLVAAIVALVYGLTRSGNHSETEDSIAFAVRVRDEPAAELLEGTHLVYLAIGRAFARVLSALGLTDDPVAALQALDVLFAATAIGGLWLLLRRAGATLLAAAAASGIAAFSYAFWRNAVDVEVYALSAAALVACLGAAWVAAREPGRRAFAVLGLANGFAVLAHVTNVVFAVVAATALVLAARGVRASTGTTAGWAASYAGAAALVVLPSYAVAAVVHRLSSPAEFWEWFTERSGQAGAFGSVGVSNLARASFGSARALVGGHFALSLDPIRDFLAGRFPGKTFSEELFFLEGFPQALAVGLLALALVAAGLGATLAGRWLLRPRVDRGRRTLAVLAVAWLVPYALLFVWWDPLNIEFWYAVSIPAAVLLAIPIDGGGGARPALVVGTVVALFAVNLLGSVLPQRDETRDLWRAKASWYRDHARADDLVVSNGYIWSAYLRYLLDAEVLDIEDVFREADTDRDAVAELRRRLAAARGRVLVSGEAFHAFADRRSACVDAPRTCTIAAATADELRHDCEVIAVTSDPPERVLRCFAAA